MAVTLYRRVGKGKARRYQKVNLGRGCRPGPVFAAILARDAAIRCDDGWAVAQSALSGHVFGEIDFDFSQRPPPPVCVCGRSPCN